MAAKQRTKVNDKENGGSPQYYRSKTSLDCFVFERKLTYDKQKPFLVYHDDLEHFVRLIKGDCIEVMNRARDNSVDMIFADPPYNLSNGGITCQAGRMVSVNKGEWDKSKGVESDHEFALKWLAACHRVLKDDGTLWVSGTMHSIYSVGFALQKLGYKLLNEICWYKHNASPNLSARYFTHSHETIIWAAKSQLASRQD